MKKFLIITFTVVFVSALALTGVWGYNNFDEIKASFNGTKLYLSKDVDNAVSEATFDLNAVITALNNQITALNLQIATLQSQVSNAEDNEEIIAVLESQITSLQSLIATLNQTNISNAELISSLNEQIEQLQAQLEELQTPNIDVAERLAQLELEIVEIKAQIQDLQEQQNLLFDEMFSSGNFDLEEQIDAIEQQKTALNESITALYFEMYETTINYYSADVDFMFNNMEILEDVSDYSSFSFFDYLFWYFDGTIDLQEPSKIAVLMSHEMQLGLSETIPTMEFLHKHIYFQFHNNKLYIEYTTSSENQVLNIPIYANADTTKLLISVENQNLTVCVYSTLDNSKIGIVNIDLEYNLNFVTDINTTWTNDNITFVYGN